MISADDVTALARSARRYLARPVFVVALAALLIFSLAMAAREVYPYVAGPGILSPGMTNPSAEQIEREREVDAQARTILASFEEPQKRPSDPARQSP